MEESNPKRTKLKTMSKSLQGKAKGEEWRSVINYEGIYEVSNTGKVKSLKRMVSNRGGLKPIRERILKSSLDGGGYPQVVLCSEGTKKKHTIHKVVATAFLNHVPCGMRLVVNHKNFIRSDNRVDNLEIITQQENTNKKHIKSTSKYVGVYWDKNSNKWMSSISFDGSRTRLGSFNSELEAYIAYESKLKEFKGELCKNQ